MGSLYIPKPKNENMLQSACLTGQSKTLCMGTIHKILASYEEELKSHTPRLWNAAKDMMQALNVNDETRHQTNRQGEASYKPSDSFSSQMKLCKLLHIFKQLTVTIDRILNYQNSPEPIPKC